MSHMQNLYGGAIIALLSDRFRDVSVVREVPDHQEVFVDTLSDASIIVELLDREDKPVTDAIHYHFNEIASSNEASQQAILGSSAMGESFMPSLNRFSRIVLMGKQLAQKHRSPSAPVDLVYIVLVLVRLSSVSTDLLITLNLPLTNFATTVPQSHITAFEQALNPSIMLPNTNIDEELVQQWPTVRLFRDFVNSMQVVDWSLFGQEGLMTRDEDT